MTTPGQTGQKAQKQKGPGNYQYKSHKSLYHITYDPKPIPLRGFDWDWCNDDYCGPGDPRCGNAGSLDACITEINDLESELALEDDLA